MAERSPDRVLDGKVPGPKGYNLTTLPDAIYCGRISDGKGWRLLQPFEVGPKGEFRRVVVFLDEIDRGKPFGAYKPPRIGSHRLPVYAVYERCPRPPRCRGCEYDPAMHDIQAYETSNLAAGPVQPPAAISTRYPRRSGVERPLTKHYEGALVTQTVKMTKGRRIFTMQCGFHAYMESWALVADHPYYGPVADDEGRFKLTDISPGTYKVKVWHPYVRGRY